MGHQRDRGEPKIPIIKLKRKQILPEPLKQKTQAYRKVYTL
jgi:hypothetical protein